MDALAVLAVLLVLAVLVGFPIMLVVTWLKVQRIDGLVRRIEQLERRLRPLSTGEVLSPTQQSMAAPLATAPLASVPLATVPSDPLAPEPGSTTGASEMPATVGANLPPHRDAIAWEDLIGRKALGWVAVVVLLFATAFFLRYAFENSWVGPLGRVTLGIVAGLVLVREGRRRHRLGWRLFAQMLTSAGIVLLYLSIYGAFGFYHLINQRAAGLFLLVLVAESALLALAYEAPAIALMAVLGGLLTPLLMHSEHDQYVSLFTYLAVLNVGAVWLLLRRNWPLIGTVSLLGTQFLFWLWYGENYHPEKLAWALGFQAVIYGLYLLQSLLANLRSGRTASWEDLTRMLASVGLLSAASYVLLEDDYRAWLGTLAVAMAAVYAGLARSLLTAGKRDDRLLLTAVAIAMGFLALAFPLQADAPWVALGWAAEASVLWWAGVRIRSMPLRAMAGILAVLAVGHVLMIDTTGLMDRVDWPRPRFTPILNDYALPALAAVACLSAGLLGTRRRLNVLAATERTLVAITAVACVLLVWVIVSVDIRQYFNMLSRISRDGSNWERAANWERLGQMSLSGWWSVYAALVLAAGFRTRQAWLRWTALALFGLTVLKVFLFDMSGLDQIYRIVAFFVLALLLGIAAWAYQRVQPEPAAENPL